MIVLRCLVLALVLYSAGAFSQGLAQVLENHVLVLDGFADRAVLRAEPPPNQLKEGALEFWCRIDQADEASCLFRFLDPFLEASIGFSPERNGMTLVAFDSEEKQVGSLDFVVELERWFHVCLVWSQSQLSVYYNGELKEQSPLSAPLELPEGAFGVLFGGHEATGKRFFAGTVDGVRIWRQGRTGVEIEQSLKQTSIRGDSMLWQAWEFEAESEANRLDFEDDAHAEVQATPTAWRWGAWRRISGRVRLSEGNPVGACVIYSDANRGRRRLGSTNTDGEFEFFVDVDPEGLSFWFESETARQRVLLDSLPAGEEVELEVHLPGHISVSGFVLTLDESKSVPGVFVEVSQVDEAGGEGPVLARDLTDRMGGYKFYDLPIGNYRLSVSDDTLGRPKPNAKGLTHLRQFSVRDPAALQRIDLKCPPSETGDWDYYDSLDGLPGYGFALIMDEPNGLWVFDQQWLRLFTGKAFREIMKVPEEWGNFGGGVALPEGGLCVGSSGSDTVPPQLHFFDAEKRFGHLRAPKGPLPAKVAVGPRGGLYVLSGERVFVLEDWRSKLDVPSESLKWKELNTPRATQMDGNREGQVWIAGPAGLTRVDHDSPQTYDAENGLLNVEFHDLEVAEDGTVWLATSGGLGRLKDGRFEWALDDGRAWGDLNAVALGTGGVGWVGTRSSGLLKVLGSHHVKLDHPEFPIEDTIYGLVEGPDGTLFVSTPGALRRYRTQRLERFDEAHGLPSQTPVLSLNAFPDSDKVVVGTAWQGPQFFDGRKFESLPNGHLFGKSYIRAMGFTSEGRQWMCSNLGLSMLDRFEVGLVNLSSELAPKDFFMTCAFAADGKAWVGRGWAGGGVICMETEKDDFNVFQKQEGLLNENVWAADIGDDGTLRVGTEQGLFEFDGTTFRSLENAGELGTLDIYSIESLPNGHLWVATSKGVFGWDGKTSFKLNIPGLPDDLMSWKVFVDSHDKLWVATDAHGVMAFDGQGFKQFTMRQGLPGNTVYDVKEGSHGAIWFATNGGVARLRRSHCEPRLRMQGVSSTDGPVPAIDGAYSLPLGMPVAIDYDWNHLSASPEELSILMQVTHEESRDTDIRKYDAGASLPLLWSPEKVGGYSLDLTLRDSGFNRSEPVRLRISAFLPWYRNSSKLVPFVVAVLVLVGGMSGGVLRGFFQRRESKRAMALMLDKERSLRADLERKNVEITEVKEKALAAAKEADDANRAKSVFVANMSHEIRSPLNAVLGYSQILRRDRELCANQMHAVKAIEKSGSHLLHLIDDMLELSRIEAGRLVFTSKKFKLTEMIRSVSEIASMNSAIKDLEWSVRWFESESGARDTSSRRYLPAAPVTCQVEGDESKLKQVLLNLVSNGIKFTRNGRVWLEVGLPRGWNSNGEGSEVQSLYFEVCDTGIGVPPEEQRSIMAPFSQGRDVAQLTGGVGLGLAICTRIVESLGGELELESKPGEGSRFWFHARLIIRSVESVPETVGPVSNSIHVLEECRPFLAMVVDDMEENRDVLSQMLKLTGMEVVVASNGAEALKQLHRCQPLVIFLDIAMPEMNGFEILQRIKDLPFCPDWKPVIVAVTAGVMDRDSASYLQAGFMAFIPKPVRSEVLNKFLIEQFPEHFCPSQRVDMAEVGVLGMESQIHFDSETDGRLLELCENYAVSEIIRLGESLMTTDDPDFKTQSREVVKLAKNGNLKALSRRIRRRVEKRDSPADLRE